MYANLVKLSGIFKYHLQKLDGILFTILLQLIKLYNRLRKTLFGPRKSVLFVGQAYYNAFYLSRELRKIGWKADVLNWDGNPASQIYYHGEDFKFDLYNHINEYQQLFFYLRALLKYDVFHFSNTNGIQFGGVLSHWFTNNFSEFYEIYVLKKLGKKIVYSNNGCLDGVSQTSFSKWGPYSVCDICIWKDEPNVCSDKKNLAWGKFRNQVTDFQCLFGGNKIDFNDAPQVHEVPEFYCLNEEIWHPNIIIPNEFRVPKRSEETVFVYHTVGNKKTRTSEAGINIKSTHVYVPLIEKLNNEGFNIEIISPEEVPNKEIKYYQAQADIFLDMLTYGWYGATAREAMMLGKPVICFIRPEWLENLRNELPDCAADLPIISATPDNIEAILKDLIINTDKRLEIGKRSREFCLKWHSDKIAAKRFNEIYNRLLTNF
jgi:hypothetical protein